MLIGRDERKLGPARRPRTGSTAGAPTSTRALADPENEIYFDAQVTQRRPDAIRKAIAAGKHVYCEKPVTATLEDGLELARLARAAGVKNGVVQDKLWLPGLLKLQGADRHGFFGRILSRPRRVRLLGLRRPTPPPQRPSWNYRKEDGGGIIVDMFCHWRYVLDNLFGTVAVRVASARPTCPSGSTRPASRTRSRPTTPPTRRSSSRTASIAQINSSWCVRVDRDDLLELQVDGTKGSAVAGLRECRIQPAAATPKPVWNPDIPSPIDYRAGWQRVPDREPYDNAFKIQWERSCATSCSTSRSRGTSSRREGRPARRARHAVLGGAALRRRPGARAVSTSTTTPRCGSPRGPRRSRLHPRRALAVRAARPPRRARGSRSPPPTSSPTRWPPATPAARRSSTGRRRSPSAATCGRTASSSPRRWTPRSAAWASTGRPRRS